MSRNVRNNDTTRPRKSGAARNRRLLEHRRRLMALGVPEEKVLQMDHPRIRMLIAKPKLIPNFVK
jgi:transcriptional regulator of nitric oxide reductase